jgi:hypothetical protein
MCPKVELHNVYLLESRIRGIILLLDASKHSKLYGTEPTEISKKKASTEF